MSNIKYDLFGRELPPEKPKPSPEKEAADASPETGPQPGDVTIPLAPSQVAPEAPAEKPDAIEVPSQLDSEPPIADDAAPSLLDFINLEARVSRLENLLYEKDDAEDADPA